jgi:hypothetical protein
VLAEVIGLRATAWLRPVVGIVAAGRLWFSPVRRLVSLPERDVALPPPDPLTVAVAVEWEQPPGA